MAEPSKTSRLRAPPAAEAAPRIAPRRKTADQRPRIQERLTMGLTVAHVARVEQLTVRRVRQIIAEMLASRETDPPAGFVQLQVARLSKAMIVARTMMMQGNLQARGAAATPHPSPREFGPARSRDSGRVRSRRSPARSRQAEAFPSPGSRRERA